MLNEANVVFLSEKFRSYKIESKQTRVSKNQNFSFNELKSNLTKRLWTPFKKINILLKTQFF